MKSSYTSEKIINSTRNLDVSVIGCDMFHPTFEEICTLVYKTCEVLRLAGCKHNKAT